MFDIGWGELVVIGIVALIAIGPKELPTVLRTLGQALAKVRRMASEFQGQFQEAMREAELHDLKKQADEMVSSVTDVSSFDPMADVQKDLQSAIESEPKSDTAGSEAGASETPAPTSETLPPIDVPMAELPPPPTEKDFAAAEPAPEKSAPDKPAPKQAGGGA